MTNATCPEYPQCAREACPQCKAARESAEFTAKHYPYAGLTREQAEALILLSIGPRIDMSRLP